MRGTCQQLFRCASIAFCLVLAACSGGGGGGGGESGDGNGSNSGTMSLSTNVLTFTAHNTNSAPPSQVITAIITGVTSETLYVVVVATGPAVASISSLDFINDTTVQGTIDPESPDVLGPGVHTSTITVYACTTDPDCSAEQLAGSPQTINVTYTITGVVASVSSLNYSIGDSSVDNVLERQFDVTGYQDWNAASNVSWLSVLPLSGDAGTVTRVTASLEQSQVVVMTKGTYTGTVTITPPSGAALTIPVTLNITRDPHLERGFPARALATEGTYIGGSESVYVTVGNLDPDPKPEILISAIFDGPLWAFNDDGTQVDGWPEKQGPAFGYPSLGNFFADAGQLEVAVSYGLSATCNYDRFVLDGNGLPLSGWPVENCNGNRSPPQIADVDGDGLDEIFYKGYSIDAYRANGQRLNGWPPNYHDGVVMAFGDVDGDSVDEVIVASHSQITAFEFNGATVAGFPFQTFPSTDSSKILAAPILTADMDGDGRCEIIEVRKLQSNPSKVFVRLYGANGSLRWESETLLGDYVGSTTVPALADLDADGLPEIIVQVEQAVYVWHGDGTLMQGWPARLEQYDQIGNTSPVVGDVDGDQWPDIVIVTYRYFNANVLVFNRNGQLHPAFPKTLPLGLSMAPAIADIDLDGRNEIVVGAAPWDIYQGMYDAVYAYDLGGPAHGPILWGQLGGGPRHQYRYPPK
ncbi:MAG: FG-GAP-like repeat-containing protein [Sulfuricaulis sp.]